MSVVYLYACTDTDHLESYACALQLCYYCFDCHRFCYNYHVVSFCCCCFCCCFCYDDYQYYHFHFAVSYSFCPLFFIPQSIPCTLSKYRFPDFENIDRTGQGVIQTFTSKPVHVDLSFYMYRKEESWRLLWDLLIISCQVSESWQLHLHRSQATITLSFCLVVKRPLAGCHVKGPWRSTDAPIQAHFVSLVLLLIASLLTWPWRHIRCKDNLTRSAHWLIMATHQIWSNCRRLYLGIKYDKQPHCFWNLDIAYRPDK